MTSLVEHRPTQVEILRAHFEWKRTITPLEARTLYRIESLSRRIVDLTRRGYEFDKYIMRDLTGKRYITYKVNKWPKSTR